MYVIHNYIYYIVYQSIFWVHIVGERLVTLENGHFNGNQNVLTVCLSDGFSRSYQYNSKGISRLLCDNTFHLRFKFKFDDEINNAHIKAYCFCCPISSCIYNGMMRYIDNENVKWNIIAYFCGKKYNYYYVCVADYNDNNQRRTLSITFDKYIGYNLVKLI